MCVYACVWLAAPGKAVCLLQPIWHFTPVTEQWCVRCGSFGIEVLYRFNGKLVETRMRPLAWVNVAELSLLIIHMQSPMTSHENIWNTLWKEVALLWTLTVKHPVGCSDGKWVRAEGSRRRCRPARQWEYSFYSFLLSGYELQVLGMECCGGSSWEIGYALGDIWCALVSLCRLSTLAHIVFTFECTVVQKAVESLVHLVTEWHGG